MKGPYERLKYDLRRVWECPACKRRERTAPTITFRHCGCQMKQMDGQAVVMKLVVDGVEGLARRSARPASTAPMAEANVEKPAEAGYQTTEISVEADPTMNRGADGAQAG